MAQRNKKKIMDLENTLVLSRGKGEGVGWMRCLRLIDADLWNGLAMRSCCGALGTISSHLTVEHDNVRKKNVYMYV